MEIFLDLPDDLAKRIEYIPNELLAEILVSLVRESILYRHNMLAESEEDRMGIGRVLALLQELKSETGTMKSVHTESTPLLKPSVAANEVTAVMPKPHESNLDDLGDLIDLLK